jgi:hypothetical protein
MDTDARLTIPAPLPFIGRHKELAALRAAYESPGSAFWPIYGRRRVGKSELIRHFAEPHPSIFLVGKRGAPAQQLMRELLGAAAVTLDDPLLASAPVESWKQVITGEAPQTLSVRYRLVDPLLRFWFHFVYPNTSLLAQIGPARVAAEIVRPRLDAYFGICFDSLCREALPVLYERERLLTPFQVGSYWGPGCQIDVVGLREDGWTDLGECKFGAHDSATEAAAELGRKAGLYPNRRGATICKRLFMRSYQEPRSPLPAGLKLHTLEELYED